MHAEIKKVYQESIRNEEVRLFMCAMSKFLNKEEEGHRTD